MRFKLSPALTRAHRANRGKKMSEPKAVEFVEAKRRARVLRRVKPYLERSGSLANTISDAVRSFNESRTL